MDSWANFGFKYIFSKNKITIFETKKNYRKSWKNIFRDQKNFEKKSMKKSMKNENFEISIFSGKNRNFEIFIFHWLFHRKQVRTFFGLEKYVFDFFDKFFWSRTKIFFDGFFAMSMRNFPRNPKIILRKSYEHYKNTKSKKWTFFLITQQIRFYSIPGWRILCTLLTLPQSTFVCWFGMDSIFTR